MKSGADRQPDIRGQGRQGAIAHLAVAGAVGKEVPRIGRVQDRLASRIGLQARVIGCTVLRRDIFAVADDRPAAVVGLFQLDVDDPGNGVRTILRGRSVAQHFDAIDGERWNQVHVDRSAAAADRAVDVQQRRDVASLAIDQDQGLIRAETAQRRRAQHIGAVGDRRLREVERRDQLIEDLVGFGKAGVVQALRGDDIDRDRTVGDGAVCAARSSDDDLLAVNLRLRSSLRGSRRRECSAAQRGEQHGSHGVGHDRIPPFGPGRPPAWRRGNGENRGKASTCCRSSRKCSKPVAASQHAPRAPGAVDSMGPLP